MSGLTVQPRGFAFGPQTPESRAAIYQELYAGANIAEVEEIVDIGGSATAGEDGGYQGFAANSGRPLGDGSKRSGEKWVAGDVSAAMLNQPTQEEALVANYVGTMTNYDPSEMDKLYAQTVAGGWGMKNASGEGFETIQGIDFKHTTNAHDYNWVFVVTDLYFSRVGWKEKEGEEGKIEKFLAPGSQYRSHAIFADSPNRFCKSKTTQGAATRTRNEKANQDFEFFTDCVKEKIRAVFDAAAYVASQEEKKDLIGRVVLPKLACGINAGLRGDKERTEINERFIPLVREILAEQVTPTLSRGHFFSKVIVPDVPVDFRPNRDANKVV